MEQCANSVRVFEIAGFKAKEMVFFNWNGSGPLHGTLHGKVVWEVGPAPHPLFHCDFDRENINDEPLEKARAALHTALADYFALLGEGEAVGSKP